MANFEHCEVRQAATETADGPASRDSGPPTVERVLLLVFELGVDHVRATALLGTLIRGRAAGLLVH